MPKQTRNELGADATVAENLWVDAIQDAWKRAVGEHRALLRGERLRSYDERGLQVWSDLCGRVYALEAVFGVPSDFDPRVMQDAAREAAVRAYIGTVIADNLVDPQRQEEPTHA